MPRIPPEELERLVESSGVALRAAGKDRMGCCPFHEDREASLVVTPSKNLWHCFSCQIGGGPIDWVMKSQGLSFRHAVELLREGVAGGAVVVQRSTVPKLAAPVRFDADDAALLAETIEEVFMKHFSVATFLLMMIVASTVSLACGKGRPGKSLELVTIPLRKV